MVSCMVEHLLAVNVVNEHMAYEEGSLGVGKTEVGSFLLQGTSEGTCFPNPLR